MFRPSPVLPTGLGVPLQALCLSTVQLGRLCASLSETIHITKPPPPKEICGWI